MGGAPVSKLDSVVANVLKDEARKGRTTKNDATLLVMSELDRRGGADRFGIGPAQIRMALKHIVGNAVSRHLKRGLPDNVIYGVFRNAPPELVEVMPKLPAWISLDEGVNAVWVPSLKATVAQWQMNSALKHKKAKQTEHQAIVPEDIAEFLRLYGLRSLEDAMSNMEAAE
jgi:hypothetical protein